MEIFRASIWEIKKSSSLKILGGVLALSHLLQFIFWQTNGQLPLQYMLEPQPMCWPMFESCTWLRIFPIALMRAFLFGYGFFATLSFLFFFFTRFTGFAFSLLVLALAPGLLLYVQDYRLSSNPGYVLMMFSLLYLFVPGKARLFRVFIVSFFVASGILKLSSEWLSGDWFLEHWPMPAKLAEWLAALSGLIELVGAAALLFRDGRYFWSAWIVMFGYLSVTWWATGFYGPTLFLGLLIFLAAQDLEMRKGDREFIYQSFIRPEPTKLWSNILLGIFWLSLAAAHFHLPGARLFRPVSSLLIPHPIAASQKCDQTTYAIFKDYTEEITVPEKAGRPDAMQCHPYLRFLDLKSLCANHSKENGFETIASFLSVRRPQDAHFKKAFEVRDFCSSNLTFKSLGLSTWITSNEE
jgi:hypothetical protein